MRWLIALWLDLWRGPFTANPGPEVRVPSSVTTVTERRPDRRVYVALRPPRAFTFERRQ